MTTVNNTAACRADYVRSIFSWATDDQAAKMLSGGTVYTSAGARRLTMAQKIAAESIRSTQAKAIATQQAGCARCGGPTSVSTDRFCGEC